MDILEFHEEYIKTLDRAYLEYLEAMEAEISIALMCYVDPVDDGYRDINHPLTVILLEEHEVR